MTRKDYDRRKSILTSTEAAAMLRISVNKLVELSDAGQIAGFRLPGSTHRRFQRAVVEEFARSHKIPINHDAASSAA